MQSLPRSAALVAAALLVACAPAAPPPAPPVATSATAAAALDAAVVARIDSVAGALVAQGRVPGVSVAVGRGGDLVFARGYGVANRETGAPVAPQHVFRIGSVTKQYTAAAVMRLAEQGRVDLDAPITAYLPDYPVQGHTVTVRQLLNHTSGIRSYTAMPQWRARITDAFTPAQMMELFAPAPFDFAPREQYRYNNSGYFLLGMIIERVADRDYATHLHETMFEPLGLSGTLYCPDEPAAGHARGYTMTGGQVAPSVRLSMTSPYAAGALCATASDLVRWTHALVAGRVVTPASYAAMTRPDTLPSGRATGYGLGLGVATWDGTLRISHGGGIPGFSTYLAYFPAHELTVAILQNSDAENAERTASDVARALLGVPILQVRDLPLSVAEQARYAGTYDLGMLRLRLYAEGDRLISQATGQPAFPLLYQGGGEFRASFDHDVRIVFEGEGDRAASMMLHQGGAQLPGRRVEP